MNPVTAIALRLPRRIAGNWHKLNSREKGGITVGAGPAACGLFFLADGPGLILRVLGFALLAQQAGLTFWILASSNWRRGFQAVCNQPRPENWREN
jgi:hypothetical protein